MQLQFHAVIDCNYLSFEKLDITIVPRVSKYEIIINELNRQQYQLF